MGTNYHNEVLRKARVLERQALARQNQPYKIQAGGDDSEYRTQQIISELQSVKEKSNRDNSQQLSYAEEVRGICRNRQAYDHSRQGPIRDDSKRYMEREMIASCGRKPNHMHNNWKP